MIHGDYHSMGYGKSAYNTFEKSLKQRNFEKLELEYYKIILLLKSFGHLQDLSFIGILNQNLIQQRVLKNCYDSMNIIASNWEEERKERYDGETDNLRKLSSTDS